MKVFEIMKLHRDVAKIVFPIILLAVLSLAPVACEPLVTIRIHNQTDKTLNIFTGETFIESAAPGKKVNWEIETIYYEYEISAKDMAGNTVYAKTFTREELIRNRVKYQNSHQNMREWWHGTDKEMPAMR